MTTQTAPGAETIPIEDLMGYEDSDDPTRKTHIVNPPMNLHIWQEGMSAQEIVTIARMTGQHITALCGYQNVPVHNPENHDLCENCRIIAEHLMSGAGE